MKELVISLALLLTVAVPAAADWRDFPLPILSFPNAPAPTFDSGSSYQLPSRPTGTWGIFYPLNERVWLCQQGQDGQPTCYCTTTVGVRLCAR